MDLTLASIDAEIEFHSIQYGGKRQLITSCLFNCIELSLDHDIHDNNSTK